MMASMAVEMVKRMLKYIYRVNTLTCVKVMCRLNLQCLQVSSVWVCTCVMCDCRWAVSRCEIKHAANFKPDLARQNHMVCLCGFLFKIWLARTWLQHIDTYSPIIRSSLALIVMTHGAVHKGACLSTNSFFCLIFTQGTKSAHICVY